MAPADNCIYIVVIITTFVVFLTAVVLSIISGVGENLMYPADTITAYYMFLVQFDIAAWVHYLWLVVGVWQAAWLLYGLLTLCRRDPQSGYALYYAPGSIPLSTYNLFSCALVSTVCSQAALSNGYLSLSMAFDVLTSGTLFFAVFFSSSTLQRHVGEMAASGRALEVSLRRGLVHNGLGLYEGWADFMVFIKLGKVLVFYGLVDQVIAGGVALLLHVLYLGGRLVAESWTTRHRHLLTPFLPPAVAMVGVVTHNVTGSAMTSLDYVIISVLVAVLFIALVRLVEICIWRRKHKY